MVATCRSKNKEGAWRILSLYTHALKENMMFDSFESMMDTNTAPRAYEEPTTLKLLGRLTEGCFEIRALKDRFNPANSTPDGVVNGNVECCILSGWKKLPKGVGKRITELNSPMYGNIFFTLNPIDEETASSAPNFESFKPVTRLTKVRGVNNQDISSRRWLLVDIDPVRYVDGEEVKGVCSTEAEKTEAWKVAVSVHDFLKENGFYEPVVCDSGNGYHLLYRVSLPNDIESARISHTFLAVLDSKFSTDKANIDVSVSNSARIVKLYGTIARKGDHTKERPHRLSGFLSFPEDAENKINGVEALSALIENNPVERPQEVAASYNGKGDPEAQRKNVEWMRDFLDEHGVSYKLRYTGSGTVSLDLLEGCIDYGHNDTETDAGIIIGPDGSLAYKCFHNTCCEAGNNDFGRFMRHFEPEYKTLAERLEDDALCLDAVCSDMEHIEVKVKKTSMEIAQEHKAKMEKKKQIRLENEEKERDDRRNEMLKPVKDDFLMPDGYWDIVDEVGNMLDMKIVKKGKKKKGESEGDALLMPEKTVFNVRRAILHDPIWKDNLEYNKDTKDFYYKFSGRRLTNEDFDFIFAHVEKHYIAGVSRNTVEMAMGVVSKDVGFDPIMRVIDELPEWDGTERIETALRDYLGAEDDEYGRYVSKLIFVSAIARGLVPGVNYQHMPILTGGQGKGKSTFCKMLVLGNDALFTDTLTNIETKEGKSQLRGRWVIEWSEMTTMKSAKGAEFVKAFISSSSDKYRPAFARREETFDRRCVFIGTTNDKDDLFRDATGNRRFLPVQVDLHEPNKDLFSKEAVEDFRQMMAEAVVVWKNRDKNKFTLYVPSTLQDAARKAQEECYDISEYEEQLLKWLTYNRDVSRLTRTNLIEKVFGLEVKESSSDMRRELRKAVSHLVTTGYLSKSRPMKINGVTHRGWEVLKRPDMPEVEEDEFGA